MILTKFVQAQIDHFLVVKYPKTESDAIRKARWKLGQGMKPLIQLGAKPIKGSFKEQYTPELEMYAASGYWAKCALNAPFKVLLKARRTGVSIPPGGKERRLERLAEWYAEFGDFEDAPECLVRWKRIYNYGQHKDEELC